LGIKTVSPQPHPASSQRFLNDPLERQKVLVLGEKHSLAHASVEHVENHPPGEYRLGRGTEQQFGSSFEQFEGDTIGCIHPGVSIDADF